MANEIRVIPLIHYIPPEKSYSKKNSYSPRGVFLPFVVVFSMKSIEIPIMKYQLLNTHDIPIGGMSYI